MRKVHTFSLIQQVHHFSSSSSSENSTLSSSLKILPQKPAFITVHCRLNFDALFNWHPSEVEERTTFFVSCPTLGFRLLWLRKASLSQKQSLGSLADSAVPTTSTSRQTGFISPLYSSCVTVQVHSTSSQKLTFPSAAATSAVLFLLHHHADSLSYKRERQFYFVRRTLSSRLIIITIVCPLFIIVHQVQPFSLITVLSQQLTLFITVSSNPLQIDRPSNLFLENNWPVLRFYFFFSAPITSPLAYTASCLPCVLLNNK